MTHWNIVPGTAICPEIPKICIGNAHKGDLSITIQPGKYKTGKRIDGEEIDCISKVYEMIPDYLKYLSIADKYGYDLDNALRKTLKYVWRKSQQGFPKCFNCKFQKDSPFELYKFIDNSISNGDEICIGKTTDSAINDSSFEDCGEIVYSIVSDKELIDLFRPLTLKQYDLKDRDFLCLKCRIKNVKVPKLNQYGYYTQEILVYDVDTNKKIKSLFSDEYSSFDDWNNGDEIILIGSVNNIRSYPLSIKYVTKLESAEAPVVLNRNSETPGYSDWRNQVIKRDEVCQCCGLDKHLEAHHLFGYKENPELATNVNNGVVLCKFCHEKYHSIYGLKNINPVDFIRFIRDFGVRK